MSASFCFHLLQKRRHRHPHRHWQQSLLLSLLSSIQELTVLHQQRIGCYLSLFRFHPYVKSTGRRCRYRRCRSHWYRPYGPHHRPLWRNVACSFPSIHQGLWGHGCFWTYLPCLCNHPSLFVKHRDQWLHLHIPHFHCSQTVPSPYRDGQISKSCNPKKQRRQVCPTEPFLYGQNVSLLQNRLYRLKSHEELVPRPCLPTEAHWEYWKLPAIYLWKVLQVRLHR